MRLKVFTTACLIMALVMVVGWFKILGSRPGPDESRLVRKTFAIRFLSYSAAIVVLVGAAGISSIFVMRQVREEFRQESMENMRLMVEGTLADHRKRSLEDPEREE